MNTRIKPHVDCWVLKVQGSGNEYIYGVFADKVSAEEFGRKECSNFEWNSVRLNVIERHHVGMVGV